MNKIFLLLILTALASSFSLDKTRVYIIGDSTAADKKANVFPETGWGTPFKQFFNADVEVINLAINGRSTKSFRKPNDSVGHTSWSEVLNDLRAGDYVLIQFGHNDEKVDRPTVGTSLQEYEQNLMQYVAEVRAKEAYPILLTSIVRRKFEDGQLVDTHGQYPDRVRSVARTLGVPMIDMEKKTRTLLMEYGEESSKNLFLHVPPHHPNYPNGKIDDTHLNERGALVIAQLVVQGIKEQSIKLAQKIK